MEPFEYHGVWTLGALAAALLATGAVAGLLAGLLGVGGGIVIVPALFYLFDVLDISPEVAMHIAVATSLATIIPTSISSTRAHMRRGSLDSVLFLKWAGFVFVGAGAGGFVSRFIDGSQLTAIFGFIALGVAANMATRKKRVLADALPASTIGNAAIGTTIGFLSSLMGIGGGTLSVPALTLFSVPMHRAVGTASAFGLVIAVPAVIGFIAAGWDADGLPPASLGYVNLAASVLIASTTIFTAPLGARIAHAINPRMLRLCFATFLGLTALRMLLKTFLP